MAERERKKERERKRERAGRDIEEKKAQGFLSGRH